MGFDEAEEADERWFAHREDGVTRIPWDTYPGHWQMAVWNQEYCERWCDNVADELEGSLWDGVLADNDVYDDYYGIRPPIEGDRTMADIRQALDGLIQLAGARLNAIDKLLVPNIAESHREPGRWTRHAAFGGGFEEVWLAHGPGDYFDPETVLTQADQVQGPGLTIMRVPTRHRGPPELPLRGGRVLGLRRRGGRGHRRHRPRRLLGNSVHPRARLRPRHAIEEPRRRGNAWSRAFSSGWAAVNINSNPRRTVTLPVPRALGRVNGNSPWPEKITLAPHEGAIFVRP